MNTKRLKVRIKDETFVHDFSTCPWTHPTYFDWVRDNKEPDEFTFITDKMLFKCNKPNSIAFLIEPPSIQPDVYNFILKNNSNYKYILTFDQEILDKCSNSLFYPFGGTRIPKECFKIHTKFKNTSMVVSPRKFTKGHLFRHECKDAIKHMNVDIFGDLEPLHNKFFSVESYRFSIVVENGYYSSYFSEKLIDCLLTGTIPIYWGCPTIDNFFNKNGILTFTSTEELQLIIKNCNEELYISKLENVRENFQKALKYKIAEDWIFLNYPFLFQSE